MLIPAPRITDISGLQSSLALWEHADYAATIVVFLGVLGETLAEFTNAFGKSRKATATKISTFVLLLGLLGEVPALIRSAALTDRIMEALRNDVAAAYNSAGIAIAEGGTANERAQQLQAENLKLNIQLENERKARLKLAADTQREVGLANARAAEANKAAAELNRDAEELKAKNLALEKAMAPRVLGIHGYDDPNLKALKQFAGTKVELAGIDDGEVLQAEGSIRWLLELAGWKVTVTVPVDPFSPTVKDFQHGVTLIPSKNNDSFLSAGMLGALMTVFSANGWKDVALGDASNPNTPVGDFQLVIFVGLRPPAYELSPLTAGSAAPSR